jgi:hypothetical protein
MQEFIVLIHIHAGLSPPFGSCTAGRVPHQTLQGGHFHLTLDPLAVATALIEPRRQMKEY